MEFHSEVFPRFRVNPKTDHPKAILSPSSKKGKGLAMGGPVSQGDLCEGAFTDTEQPKQEQRRDKFLTSALPGLAEILWLVVLCMGCVLTLHNSEK